MARKLPIPNGRLDGALDANGQRIVNLVDPMSGDDAATKAYVDARDAASAAELGKQVDAALGTKQDTLSETQLAAVNSGITSAKISNMVTKSDVEPVGDGTEVIARIGGKEIKAPAGGGGASDFISDANGNVINADRSVTVSDGTWTCEGVVLPKIRENVWQDDESGYAIGASVGGGWYFTPDGGKTFGFCEAPDDAKELAFEVGGRTYSAKFGRSDSLLTTADVQPEGSGTVLIATIGGKQIKAPAGGGGGGGSVVESTTNPGYAANADAANSVPWSGVADKPTSFDPSKHAESHATGGGDPITAEDIGALPITGGSLHDDSGFVALNVGISADGSRQSTGVVRVYSNGFFPARIEVNGEGASIKKGDKEVATEDDVKAVSDKVDEISDSVSTDNRFLVDDTTAAIQTRESEDAEWSDEIRVDKGYDAVQGTTMVKLDKSVQTVTVNGGTLEVVFPDPVDGTVRDLCLYVNNTDSTTECEMTFPDGTYYGADGWDAAAQKGGITGYYFSEIPGNGWRVSREELKQFTKGA